MSYLSLQIRYNNDEIIYLRQKIKNIFVERAKYIQRNPLHASSQDVKNLFYLYDQYYFSYFFSSAFLPDLRFSLSNRMTRTAGKIITPKNLSQLPEDKKSFEIRMSGYFLSNYDQFKGERKVNGIVTTDAVQAFQLVLEHEICHLIEFVEFGTSNCKKKRFKDLAYRLFGHTETYHELSIAKRQLEKQNQFQAGDKIYFYYHNKKKEGIIQRITKRATVMVKDSKGRYMDFKKNRYTKYYVPLDWLYK